MQTLNDFLSSRAAAFLLTAVLFMFLVGVHVSGHSDAMIDTFMAGFGGALLTALNGSRAPAPAAPEAKPEASK